SLSESEDASIGRAHIRLSRSCIRYVAMDEIRGWRCKHKKVLESVHWWEDDWEKYKDEFPFLGYATTLWRSHAELAEAKGMLQEELLDYFRWPSPQILQHWVGICRFIDQFSDERPPPETTLLHVAAGHGLISVVKSILNKSNIV